LDQIAYVNGSFVPLTEAKVSVLDRGFLFADGIYEVSAVIGGKLIDNASHLRAWSDRLARSRWNCRSRSIAFGKSRRS
jgi:branched-subunit amino acid aminotransferase/4-amino-4-deoxychorismate lyase